MFSRRSRVTALVVAVLAGFVALACLPSAGTQALWSASASKPLGPLNYGTMGVTFVEHKRALTPYFDITNSKTFGQAPKAISVTIGSGDPLTTTAEVNGFLDGQHGASFEPYFGGTLTVSGHNDTVCAAGAKSWTTGATYKSTAPTATTNAAAFPLPTTKSVSRCLSVATGLTQRKFYEWWSGREFSLTVNYDLQTAAPASWTGTQSYTAKYVIPIPAPKPPTSGGACTEYMGDVTMNWRWPDQTSSTSTATTGVHHWNVYGRKKGATNWTYINTPASGDRYHTWSSWGDLRTLFPTNGSYEFRLVAFPFANESKYMPAPVYWNMDRIDDFNWACAATQTTANTEKEVGYDVVFPTFPDTL